jgi:hypothetical protein
MKVVDGEEVKVGKRAGNYGVCKAKLFKCSPFPEKRKSLSAQHVPPSAAAVGVAEKPRVSRNHGKMIIACINGRR